MKSLFYFALCGFVISQFADNSNGFGGGINSGFGGMDSGFGGSNGGLGGSNGGFDSGSDQPATPRGSPALPAVNLRFIDLTRPSSTRISNSNPSSTPVLLPNASDLSFNGTNSTSNFDATPVGYVVAVPSGNSFSENKTDSSLGNDNTLTIIAIICAVIGSISILAVVLFFYLKRSQKSPFQQGTSKRFDEENQKDYNIECQKYETIVQSRMKNNASPPISVVESTWTQESDVHSSPQQKIRVEIPSKFKIETMKGPISAMSDISIFETKKALTTMNKKESYFIHSFNKDLETIDEDTDIDDDDSLFDVKHNVAYPKKSTFTPKNAPIPRDAFSKSQNFFENLKNDLNEAKTQRR